MGISFRLLSVEDIGDLRELLENDGMLYHPQYLAHFLCHPELALSARSKKIDQWEWACCYLLPRLDGKTMFFLYSLDILPAWQGRGVDSRFMVWLADYDRKLRCSELFVITDKENPAPAEFMKKLVEKASMITRLSM